jgi:hypothetical protein
MCRMNDRQGRERSFAGGARTSDAEAKAGLHLPIAHFPRQQRSKTEV